MNLRDLADMYTELFIEAKKRREGKKVTIKNIKISPKNVKLKMFVETNNDKQQAVTDMWVEGDRLIIETDEYLFTESELNDKYEEGKIDGKQEI